MDYKEYLAKIRNKKLTYIDWLPLNLSTCEYNIHLLLNRLSEAKQSYVLLMEDNKYMDAMLIAGHIFEICAMIDCLSEDLIENKQKTKEYIAKGYAKALYDLLEFAGDINIDQYANEVINKLIAELKIRGGAIFKGKNTTHNEKIDAISSAKLNSEKMSVLRNYYQMYRVEDYLEPYRMHLSEKYGAEDVNNDLILFYSSYCRIKHCGAAMCTPKLIGNTIVMNRNQYRDSSPIIVWMCLEYTEKNIKSILSKNKN